MTLTPRPEERVAKEQSEQLARIAPEEVLESERGSLVTGLVIARAWRDPGYRDRLLHEPAEVLNAAGLEVPDGVRIRVFEDTPEVRHVALTSLTSEPEELLPLLRELTPLPEGAEVRLIQNSEQALCLVVPLAPAEPEMLTDVEILRRLAPRAATFAGGDVVQTMAEAFTVSEAALEGAAEVSAAGSAQAFAQASGDVVQSASASFTQSEAALLGAAEASAQSAAQSAAQAAAQTSVSTNTTSVTNTNTYSQTNVSTTSFEATYTMTTTALQAEVAGVELEAAATTTTAVAEAEAVAVAVIVLT
jgi:hypothetical protein